MAEKARGAPGAGKAAAAEPAKTREAAAGTASLDAARLQAATALVGAVLKRSAVLGARAALPIAELYAPLAQDEGAPQEAPSPDKLTARERAVLGAAAKKLVLEAGQLLVASFPPTPAAKASGAAVGQAPAAAEGPGGRSAEGQPAAAGELPDELSLGMVVSAVKAVLAWQEARAAAREAEAEKARAAERSEQLRPVTVTALRVAARRARGT